ncbi:guanylate kinase [Thermocrinis albus DSM 14484]|uniref:Guanylate kinase n=1 Tax=Thermocrinis albus (strain DSM 14484 / JCM 11386 / HI 11/12) TaxID=638303 RepID=D3SPL2_THEAH|nr:guanylate kinase [Thermocrinis albus]ADC89099.1 guanylate kinase [Thermocrinis albus DSM 14484]
MPNLFVLSAPSGAGKTTVAKKLLKEVPMIRRVVTATTRQKREDEVEGEDYIFLTQEEFMRGLEEGRFLEHALVYGNYYGTPKDQVIRNMEEGYDSLLVIDVQGAKQVRQTYPEAILIFLLPPSLEELRRRLFARGYRESNLEERIRKAEEELACARYFDYLVVNEFLDDTVQAVKNIILSTRYRRDKFLQRHVFLLQDQRLVDILLKGICQWG